MKDILKRIDELIGSTEETAHAASAGAEYPAMFLYVGEKAAERCAPIRAHLKEKLMNGSSILHAVMGAQCADADIAISVNVPPVRGETLAYLNSDSARLTEFSAVVSKTVDSLMMTSGFPHTNRCHLFIVTVSDHSLNALLPEFVILFSDNAHIRVNTCLFVEFGSGSEGYLYSGAFFRELEECQDPGFVYDGAAVMRDEQRIPVHWEGAVFDAVFFLEMYRSDMKYSPHNAEKNARIEAMTAVLRDRQEPVALPNSPFCTAGISSAEKPTAAVAHIIYKSLIDILAGVSAGETPKLPLAQLTGYDVIAAKCDNVILSLPDISNIISVLPRNAGSDPDNVRNTSIRDILGYYGGEDERYFTEKYENVCAGMIDMCGGADIEEILRTYINKGTLRLGGALGLLEHDGDISACLAEVTERLNSEEEDLKKQLDTLLSEPCGGLAHGLFAKPSGCEILAAAISRKYSKKLEILRVRMMKRLAANILSQVNGLHASVSAALGGISAFSETLKEDILKELYESESTLTDAAPFMYYYAEVTKHACDEFDRTGGMSAVLRGRDLYGMLMSCGENGTAELADTSFEIYRKLLADPSVREVFARTFDKELYERYRSYDGGKDRGWVDAQLVSKLSDESCANLRYSVFQPSNSLFIMGNRDIDFVRKMLVFDDPAFNTVHVGDVSTASYEQLAVYNVPSADSVVYVNECRKVYETFAAENGDSVYVGRGA